MEILNIVDLLHIRKQIWNIPQTSKTDYLSLKN